MQRNYYALVLLVSACMPAHVLAMAGGARRAAGQAARAAGEYLSKESGALKQEAKVLGEQAEVLGKQAEVLAQEAEVAGKQAQTAAKAAEGTAGRGSMFGRMGQQAGENQGGLMTRMGQEMRGAGIKMGGEAGRGAQAGRGTMFGGMQREAETQKGLGLLSGMGGQTRGMATDARGSKGLGDILSGSKIDKAKDKIATTTLKDVYALKDNKSALNKLLYELFGVNPGENIDKKILKELYYTVAKKFHPDANPSDQAFANQVMRDVNNFYDMLLQGKSEEDIGKTPEQPMRSYDPNGFARVFDNDTVKGLTGYSYGAWNSTPIYSTRNITEADRAEIKKASELWAQKMPEIDKKMADLVNRALKIPGIQESRSVNNYTEMTKRYGEEWYYSNRQNRKFKGMGLANLADFVTNPAEIFKSSDLMNSLFRNKLYEDVESKLEDRIYFIKEANEFLDKFDAAQAQKAYNAKVEAEILTGDDSF